MTLSLKGTATALVTPFNQDGSVDLGAFEALVHWQIENGIDVLCTLWNNRRISDSQQ